VRSIHWSVNDRPAEVTNLPSELLWGEETIEEELCGLRFRLSPNAFLQTNTAMAERLYGLAGEYAGVTGEQTVWDLYCGIGTIGLSLASQALTVWGIEVSEESVARAIENADLNGITNTAFFAGNVGEVVEELLERSGPPDVVIVDRAGREGIAPPRAHRRAADRLRLVQSDDARLRREAAPGRLGLRAGAGAARGHVPAHAARRDGGAAGAGSEFRAARAPLETAQVTDCHFVGSASGSSSRFRSSRSRRQIRSAFGARKAMQRSGSAGRPPIPNGST
jgi:hypothetical protein